MVTGYCNCLRAGIVHLVRLLVWRPELSSLRGTIFSLPDRLWDPPLQGWEITGTGEKSGSCYRRFCVCSHSEPLDNLVVQHAIVLLFKTSVLCYVDVIQRPTNSRMLKMDDQEFEKARKLEYLGYDPTEDNNTTIEITMTNWASYDLKKQLISRYFERERKCPLHKTFVSSVITYGSESLPLKKKGEHMLRIFERKLLRRIYGTVRNMVYGDQGIITNFINYVMNYCIYSSN